MKNKFLILAIFMMISSGCAENSSSLVIVQNQSPETSCTASNTVADNFISHGILDLGAARYNITPQYYGWFVIENNLTSTIESHGIELNNVEIKEAHIDLSLAQAGGTLGSDITQFADYTFVTIPPGETRSVQVNLIPPNVAQRLTISSGQFIEVFAKVQLIGERGGTEIVTNSINFPVTLCYGCLVENIGPCDTATFPEIIEQGHSCNMSQDLKLHCCYDSNSADADNPYRCPAVEGTTTVE
ncbi:MAG: hypothetical protein JXR95_09180 [Deltaproteobacteria bacterium]|nr:hypothetical protein [Deltaproteobacteria bacterium]